MVQVVLESVMLICFGISWPISVYKSYKTKSTKGKSLIFLLAIMIGYVAGITAKIAGGAINYVLIIYIFNLTVVSIDFALYFINKHGEKEKMRMRQQIA
ncbi:MAG: hypothetical protein E7385_08370 [Ruminococcaceae bacterium]|nr:hypothetical protein [Oscillospiraceae bacterium]